MYCTTFLGVTWTNFSDRRTFWRELLRRRHGYSQCHRPPSRSTLAANQSARHLQISVLTYKALHTGQPCYWADSTELYRPSRVYDLLILTFLLFLPVLSVLLPLELFVYLRLIVETLFLCISVHLTVLLLSNPVLNLIFLLLPITSSLHSHASSSDSTFDYWRYINISFDIDMTPFLPDKSCCFCFPIFCKIASIFGL